MSQSKDDEYRAMWDNRYRDPDYAYGTEPNIFFKQQLDELSPGRILMPADGEGRNGVYAATQGWEVTCCDLSIEGKKKALQYAKQQNVSIDYLVGDLAGLDFQKEYFDAVGLIYAHFLADKKSSLHRAIARWVKPGGCVILEGFSKENLERVRVNPKIGGPRDIDMLFSTEEIASDFCDFEVVILIQTDDELEEGVYHQGNGSVVRFVGTKILPTAAP